MAYFASIFSLAGDPTPALRPVTMAPGRRCLLVSGRPSAALTRQVEAAVAACPKSITHITVAVLPALSPDDAAARTWRMKLQRRLRAQVGGQVAVAVEYERWRGFEGEVDARSADRGFTGIAAGLGTL